MFADGDAFHRRQVAVTYIHQPHLWRGPVPRFAGRELANTFSHLTASGRLTILLIGDSISEGYNASGFTGVALFQPAFGQLVADALERAYGATVSFHNFAVAGSTADNGIWETASVRKLQPDLVLIAYGMNDAGCASATDFVARIQKIMGEIRSRVPDAEFVLVAPMLPHREWDYVIEGRIPEYRDCLAALCDEGVVLADVTSLWSALTHKSHYDLSGNGINHPTDFGHRMYAETILGLLIET
jgi:lysophospholipase L1-like esterase